MKPAAYAYARPRSIEEALRLLADDPTARVLAGGQSLVPTLAMRIARPGLLVDLLGLPGTDGVEWIGDELRIGATVTQATIEADPLVRERLPLLAGALDHVGHLQTRARGTIGGSLAHLDPTAELALVALLLGAVMEVVGPGGARELAWEDWALGPYQPALAPGEILLAVRFRRAPAGAPWTFHEAARRHGDLALAMAAGIRVQDGVRIGIGALGDVPRRLPSLEAAVADGSLAVGEAHAAARAALLEVEIEGNALDGGPDQRRAVAGSVVARVVADLVAGTPPTRTRPPAVPRARPRPSPDGRHVAADERAELRLTLNGETRTAEVEPRTSLVDALRHDLGLHGTHVGCEHGACGACTVLLDGVPTLSCLVPALAAHGSAVETVEGLASGPGAGDLSPLQRSFRERFALQCGYCTPGFLMTATGYLRCADEPGPDEVREAISGVLCRCTGYAPIVDAIVAAGREQRRKP